MKETKTKVTNMPKTEGQTNLDHLLTNLDHLLTNIEYGNDESDRLSAYYYATTIYNLRNIDYHYLSKHAKDETVRSHALQKYLTRQK